MNRVKAESAPLIDLFCGSGGFSLGAHRAGYRVGAAVDNDPILTSSYRANFPSTRLLLRDVVNLTGEELLAAAGGSIHGILGGPPCQGFSEIGRRDPSDPRSQLLDHYFRLVTEAKPAFFVMENVRGLLYRDSSHVLDRALQRVKDEYALLGPVVLDASDFGAATKRVRLFVVGVNKDRGEALTIDDILAHKRPAATVKAAINDLANAVEEVANDGFDHWRIAHIGRPSEYARTLRARDGRFTGHRPTVHTDIVKKRFAKVPQGGEDRIGRHPRLMWDGQCPTLRAGTGADHGSYQSVRPIHPDLPRVITVREAARLQGFPDTHLFHPTVWHSFRMIGNSVCPVIAEAIFRAIAKRVPCKVFPKQSANQLNGSFVSKSPTLADAKQSIESTAIRNNCPLGTAEASICAASK